MTLPPAPAGVAHVEGAAFPRFVKALAVALLAAIVVAGARAAPELWSQRASWPMLLALLVLAIGVGLCFWWILHSRIRISETAIDQTWWSPRHVAIAEITRIKLVLVPGLTWLIVPRLIVRTREPGSIVFYAAEPQVIAAFARLSLGEPPLPRP